MQKFHTHSGHAIVMDQDNVSTDQIIPSHEMKRVAKTGLADGLFANLRYTDAAEGGRTPDPDFILNQPHAQGTSILIAGANFGCGSSREHAVWALREFGFRVVIAESFGTIFFDNCIANGVLPVPLERPQISRLADNSSTCEITVDLVAQRLSCGMMEVSFSIPESRRQMLLQGFSPIDVTLKDRDLIEEFIAADADTRPWLYNTGRAL